MAENYFRRTRKTRIIVGISIILAIALIHIFRVGSYLHGDLYLLYYSYASDIIIPFGIYFLLCIDELYIKILGKWYVKVAIILGFTTFAEILQFFGIYALGETYDPIDILAYAVGVGSAAIFDKLVFSRFIPFWNYKSEQSVGKTMKDYGI